MDQAGMKRAAAKNTIEIEKKYRISQERLNALKNDLTKMGAEKTGTDDEENTIYAGGSLPSGSALRIRRTQEKSFLTFKRRLANVSNAKRQVEYESEISEPDNVDQIIREFGLRPSVIYEKRREKYRIRSAEVAIDELPFGLFVEIEGALTAIIEVELLLGIDDLTIEENTYPTLTRVNGKRVGGRIEARFARPE